MKITKLILKNFRSYQDIIINFDENFNTIIGKNDVGKSTILEALDIFLEGNTVKIDPSDCNVFAKDKKITIGVIFKTEENKDYLLDTDVTTTLEQESLLNKKGFLEIHKKWDCRNNTITAKNLSIYFNSYYFSEFKENSLITLKNIELKKILESKSLECKNKTINSEIRQAIYNSFTNVPKEEILIQIDKEDSKKTWEVIKNELPMLFLFQSDRANKDSDKDVQDPLKAITKKAVSGVEAELNKVVKNIRTEIETMANLTIEKIKEMAPEIAKDLIPNITNKAWDSLFSFSFDGDDNIPMNKHGSGVRRLILLNYFRVIAEQKITEGRNAVYAIEEPETSQHPNYQNIIIKALQELGEQEKSQVMITTHSPEIAKFCGVDSLIFLQKEGGNISVNNSDTKLSEIANTLGIMPYLSKFCVFVEGSRDIDFLKNINSNIAELKHIVDLEEIQILPIFGSNVKNWINREYIEKSNIKAFYLLDGDKDDNKSLVEKINNKSNECKAQTTTFLMMENYCPPSLIKNRFNIDITKNEEKNWKRINVIELIEQKSGGEKNGIKDSINKNLSTKITKKLLEDIGAWDEVKGWFEIIAAMNKAG